MTSEGPYKGVFEQTEELPEGYELEISTMTVQQPDKDGVTLQPLHVGSGAFLAIAARGAPGVVDVHGSAVMLAPGIAVTAKHVMEEVRAVPGLKSVYGLAMNEDRSITSWHVAKYHGMGDSDVVLLAIQPSTPLNKVSKVRRAVLHVRAPEVGERLTVVGFREAQSHSPVAPGGLVLLCSTGPVTEVYGSGRDRVLLPNPCVAADLTIVGGMSGGPAFDKYGRLIGVASTSYDNGRPSFISLIWSCIVWPFSPVWPPKLYPSSAATLREIGPPFLDIVDGHRVVSVSGNGNPTLLLPPG